MMAGRGRSLSLADWLVTFPCSPARRSISSRRARAASTIDGTFGAGGHTRAILHVEGTRVIGIDRDRNAIAAGYALVEEAAGRLTLAEDRFSNLEHVARGLGHEAVDGILLDLGVSSMQLDRAGARLLVPQRRPARHAHGRRRRERRRSGERRIRARSCLHHRDARRGALRAQRRARDREGARRASRSRPRGSSPMSSQASCVRIPARCIRRRARSRRCACS